MGGLLGNRSFRIENLKGLGKEGTTGGLLGNRSFHVKDLEALGKLRSNSQSCKQMAG